MKLDAKKFAIAGGIIAAITYAWTTLAALLGVPGFLPFAKLLEQGYGPYGYSITVVGVVVGAIWGFIEGFIWLGLFALIYNKMVK